MKEGGKDIWRKENISEEKIVYSPEEVKAIEEGRKVLENALKIIGAKMMKKLEQSIGKSDQELLKVYKRLQYDNLMAEYEKLNDEVNKLEGKVSESDQDAEGRVITITKEQEKNEESLEVKKVELNRLWNEIKKFKRENPGINNPEIREKAIEFTRLLEEQESEPN